MTSKARNIADLGSNDVIETTATGVDVTGTVTADGLTIDGLTQLNTTGLANGLTITGNDNANVKIRFDNIGAGGGDFAIQSGVNGLSNAGLSIRDLDNSAQRIYLANNGDVSFYEDTGTTAKFVWDSSAESLGIGTSSPSSALHVVAPFTSGISGAYIEAGEFNKSVLTLNHTNGAVNVPLLSVQKSGSDVVTVDSSGNVGIGESNPDTSLDVVGGSADTVVDTLTLKNDSNGASAGVGINFVVDGANDVTTSAIYGQRTGASYHQGSLKFLTKDNTGGGLLERMIIDSSGRVGIGTASPSSLLHAKGTADVEFTLDSSAGAYTSVIKGLSAGGGSSVLRLLGGQVGTTYGGYVQGTSVSGSGARLYLGVRDANTDRTAIEVTEQANIIKLSTAGSERLRIDSSGRFLVGTTSPSGNDQVAEFKSSGLNHPMVLRQAGSSTYHNLVCRHDSSGAVQFISFRNSVNTERGFISTDGTSMTYGTSSDYRLKENVTAITGSIDRVKALNPCRFNFIDAPDKTVDGFIAHEAQEVVPEAVTGTKDEVGADGNPKYQGIDQSKLVPLLTAALQEAITKIEQLEFRIETLENK